MIDDLSSLSDHQLVAEADKAWQQGDTQRAEAIKAERALRNAKAKIHDRARRFIDHAGLASMLITAGSFIFALISFLNHHRVIDLLLILFSISLAALTWGIFKGNRFAAIAMTILFFGNIAFAYFLDPSHNIGGIVTVAFAYFLLRGIQGTFELRRIQQESQKANTF